MEVSGVYVNNHTISCNVTAPKVTVGTSALLTPLSLSFNGKQQYTSSIPFWYSPRDSILSFYPQRQYVEGNQKVNLKYTYFFDYTYKLAACKF